MTQLEITRDVIRQARSSDRPVRLPAVVRVREDQRHHRKDPQCGRYARYPKRG